MAEYTALAPLFTDIANAIRSKTGETGAITANLFPQYITSIKASEITNGEIYKGKYINSVRMAFNISSVKRGTVLFCNAKNLDNRRILFAINYADQSGYYKNALFINYAGNYMFQNLLEFLFENNQCIINSTDVNVHFSESLDYYLYTFD